MISYRIAVDRSSMDRSTSYISHLRHKIELGILWFGSSSGNNSLYFQTEISSLVDGLSFNLSVCTDNHCPHRKNSSDFGDPFLFQHYNDINTSATLEYFFSTAVEWIAMKICTDIRSHSFILLIFYPLYTAGRSSQLSS